MPRLTKAMLVEQNAELERRIAETSAAYWSVSEQLQRLGEDFGCLAGMNRLHWLRERLERLRVLEQRVSP